MAPDTTNTLPDIPPTLAVDDALAMEQFNQLVIAESRANRGKSSEQFTDAPMLLLNTIGARSGAPRTTPLGYIETATRTSTIAMRTTRWPFAS